MSSLPVPPPYALRLRLLGPLELTRADGTSLGSILAQPKRLALLVFLALGGGGGGFQRRDVLLNLFWPEFDQERARSALRKALYFLRQSLGEGVILARGDEELGLDLERIWCDALAFQAAAGADRLDDALALYRGDLLPGFFLPEAAEFEHWLDAERLRLRLQAAALAARLSERAEAAGELDEAVRRAQEALVLDAQSEPALRRLVELLHSRGDRAGVARAYEVWRRRLEEEYGIEPSAETQQLIAVLLAEGSATAEAARQRSGPLPAVRPEEPVSEGPAYATASPLPASRAAGRPRRRLAWAGTLTGLAVLLAGAIIVRGMPTPQRERVLVAVFENQTGDPALDPVGRMAADWIARGLMEIGSVEVVSIASALYPAPEATEQGIRGLAAQTGAGTVVAGTYYLEGGTLHLQAQVTDAVRGRLLHTLEPVRVPVDSATAGAELLRERLAGALAARFAWSSELTDITQRSQPPTYAAYREYIAGLELFHRGQEEQALERFERAWALDTTFYHPLLFSSLMHLNLRNPARADSLLRRVALHQARLTHFETVLLENLQSLMAGDHETGLRLTRRLNEMAPGSLHAGQARMAVATNRPREAIAAFRRLAAERQSESLWLGYWWWLATAHHMLGEHRQELKVAREGRQHYPERLLLMENRALAALGRVEELEQLLQESRSLSAQQRWTPADALRNAAIELRAHGHTEAASRFLEEALAWYRARPEAEQPRLRPMYARTLYEARQWEAARAIFEELAAEPPANVHHLGHLGTLAARRGERAEAERISAALAASTQPYLLGAHTLWRARIAAQLGDSEEALLLLRQALAQGQGYDLWLHTDLDLDPLRDLRAFRALIRPKG